MDMLRVHNTESRLLCLLHILQELLASFPAVETDQVRFFQISSQTRNLWVSNHNPQPIKTRTPQKSALASNTWACVARA